jgi:hypothetical protein
MGVEDGKTKARSTGDTSTPDIYWLGGAIIIQSLLRVLRVARTHALGHDVRG